MTPAAWLRIGKAMEIYARFYKPVEVSWSVSVETMLLTCPSPDLIVHSDFGPLIGSSEQAFLELARQDALPGDRLVTCTPCFRTDGHSTFYRPGFMKVELFEFICEDMAAARLQDMVLSTAVDRAYTTMTSLMMDADAYSHLHDLRVVKTDIGYDIELGGVEVGSYGYRECLREDYTFLERDLRWVYGTGLAEPRFTAALENLRETHDRGTSQP